MVQETQGVNKGAGDGTKVQAMVQVCTAVDKGGRAHETWPMVQARHRQGCTAMEGWCEPHMVWMSALEWHR